MNSIQSKIDAIKTLLEFSLLFSNETKIEILSKLEKFTEIELDMLGEILSKEHYNRSSLDEETVKSYLEAFNKNYAKRQ